MGKNGKHDKILGESEIKDLFKNDEESRRFLTLVPGTTVRIGIREFRVLPDGNWKELLGKERFSVNGFF